MEKEKEALDAAELGASELDMVINWPKLKERQTRILTNSARRQLNTTFLRSAFACDMSAEPLQISRVARSAL
jgi:hypothetical protein